MIIFDCDGVICDFTRGFYDYYSEKYNTMHGPISRFPKTWNFDFTGDPVVFSNIITEYIDTKPIIPLMDSSIPSVMEKLKEKYQIFIVSHYHDKKGRKQNLDHIGILKGIHYDNLVCLNSRDEKMETITGLNPIYYVEDSPDIINTISKKMENIQIFVPSKYEYTNLHKPMERIKMYDSVRELLELIV